MTKAACEWLKCFKLSNDDITRGKNILKTEILDAADNSLCLLESMQQQAVLKGNISSPTSLVNDIDQISSSDVKDVFIYSIILLSILIAFNNINTNKCFLDCRQTY